VYFKCPTCYIHEPVAQINGDTVYFVYGLSKPRYFGMIGKKFYGVAVVNSKTGEVKIYKKDEIPAWITVKYPESLVEEWFSVWGKYINGLINYITTKRDVKIPTGEIICDQDSGVIVRGTDVQLIYTDNGHVFWYSLFRPVKSTQSSVGIAFLDMDTGKIYYIKLAGKVISDEMATNNIYTALGADIKTMMPTEPILYIVNNHYFYVSPIISIRTSEIVKYAVVDAINSKVYIDDTFKGALEKYVNTVVQSPTERVQILNKLVSEYSETSQEIISEHKNTVAKIIIINGNQTIVIPIAENSTIKIEIQNG